MKGDAQLSGNISERTIVENLKKGDKKAFEVIYYQYRLPLKTFACTELKEASLAEDAVHDIFLKLWLKRDTLDPSLPIKSYLFICLKNHILNIIRTQKNRILKHMQAAQHRNHAFNPVEDTFVLGEYLRQFEKGMAQLSANKRTILKFSIFEGLHSDEIAEKMNISANTVKIYLSQTTRQMKATLKE